MFKLAQFMFGIKKWGEIWFFQFTGKISKGFKVDSVRNWVAQCDKKSMKILKNLIKILYKSKRTEKN